MEGGKAPSAADDDFFSEPRIEDEVAAAPKASNEETKYDINVINTVAIQLTGAGGDGN
jgi:hypothetical protein